MGSEIDLVSDGDGLAVIGNPADVERFFLAGGLGKAPSRDLDLHRPWSFSGDRRGRCAGRCRPRGELRTLGEADR